MNHIEIKYSYFSQKAELNMNGEKVSTYSELATILNHPFLESVGSIIPGLDNEIFDDYKVDLYSTVFQYEVLLKESKKSEYCKEIHFHEIEALMSKELLIETLSDISGKYNISINKEISKKVYCSSQNIDIPQRTEFLKVDIPNADVGIFENSEVIPPTVITPVILSEGFGVLKKDGRICYCVPREKINLFWEYYENEFINIPMILEYLTALKYAKLDEIYKIELTAIRENKPDYYIGDVPIVIDEGDTFEINFVSFPEDYYKLQSENPKIILHQETSIIAKNPGATNLNVSDQQGKIIFSKTIRVIGHQYVEAIRLVPRFEFLKKNERNRIDVVVTPLNAEDANKLIWDISNPSIVQIDANGSVIALKEGKTMVTVSSRNITASIEVCVRPGLQRLSFYQQSIRIKNGETVIIDCDITPEDAPAENLTWELDNKTIASINPSKNGKRCQIIASKSYEGKGNVRCYDSMTKLGAICNIEVVSKVKQGILGKIAFICMLIGMIIPYLLPISIGVSVYGLIKDEEVDHRRRYIICAIGSIIVLIFWMKVSGG